MEVIKNWVHFFIQVDFIKKMGQIQARNNNKRK